MNVFAAELLLSITIQAIRGCPWKTSTVREEGVYPVRTFCGQERGLQMRTSALFGAKYIGLFEIYR